MPGSSAMFRTIEPHARTMASVFRLEWLPAVAKLSRNGLYAWEDVPYRKDSSDVKHTLDVFIPGKGPGAEFPRPKTPVVLFWHGGSWRRGDKQWKGTVYSNIGIACARAGYVGAVCNYRLRPQAPSWEEQVDDLAAAVAWAWRSADRFGGDGQRLFLVGHSAGAHLVSSLLSDCSALERQGMSAEEARRVLRGVVLMAGVYDVPRLARLPVGGLQIAKAIFGERGDGVGWARASPSKVLRAVGKRADLFRREGGGGAALSPREAAAEDAASSAGGRRGGNTAPEGRASAPSAPGAAGSSDVLAAAAVRCPLLDVPVMVLNAKDDFHLDGDAVSLIRSMRLARRQLRGDPALAGAERLADLRAAAQTAGEKATAAGAMSAAAQAAIDDDAADDADTEDEHDYAEAWWSMTGDAPRPEPGAGEEEAEARAQAARVAGASDPDGGALRGSASTAGGEQAGGGASGGRRAGAQGRGDNTLRGVWARLGGDEQLSRAPEWIRSRVEPLLRARGGPGANGAGGGEAGEARQAPPADAAGRRMGREGAEGAGRRPSGASRGGGARVAELRAEGEAWAEQAAAGLAETSGAVREAAAAQLESLMGSWQSWSGAPERVASSVVRGLERETELLWGRVARARRGRKVAEFKDEAALPPPLIEWEWLVPGQDGEDAWEGGPSPPKKAQASAAGGQEGPGKRARTSQRGLRLHAQPGTNAVWGRVEHRNHITLVALVGQEGDPTTAAMVEFFNEGHRRVATEPQGTWQEDKQERA
mmetsp:Transcript_9141/g.35754  ORF Transcript_9141/g.35754 Transcript_9141/m.35754 type:complete len:763 (-) Transcript_9141:44-2332(-)